MISQLESARRHRTQDEQTEPYVWYQDYFFAGIFLFFCLCVKNREEADNIRKLSGYIPLFVGFTIWHSQNTQPFNVLQVKLTIIALQYLMPECIGDVSTLLINWSWFLMTSAWKGIKFAWTWMKPHLWNWMKPHLDHALHRAGLQSLQSDRESIADEGGRGRSAELGSTVRLPSPQRRMLDAERLPPAQEPAVPAQEHVVPAQQSVAIVKDSVEIANESAEISQERVEIAQERDEIAQEPAAPVTSNRKTNRKPKRTHDLEEPRRSVRRKR